MSEPLPKTDHMIDEIIKVLFEAEHRRLGNWTDKLCRQNRDLHRDPELQGFLYSGKVYKPTDLKINDSLVNRRGLHSELIQDMDTFLMDQATLTRDKSFIRQALFSLLDPCQELQCIRDTLPNCLAEAVECVRGMPRGVNAEAFTIADNPRALRQYQKILPRIEMYAVSRLIY